MFIRPEREQQESGSAAANEIRSVHREKLWCTLHWRYREKLWCFFFFFSKPSSFSSSFRGGSESSAVRRLGLESSPAATHQSPSRRRSPSALTSANKPSGAAAGGASESATGNLSRRVAGKSTPLAADSDASDRRTSDSEPSIEFLSVLNPPRACRYPLNPSNLQ